MFNCKNDNVSRTESNNTALNSVPFQVVSQYVPAGDQPYAIEQITKSLETGNREQVLLGVTGSGKTFTMAKIIEKTQRPALIIAPNKILAAQLYGEFKNFFPMNSVEYFVSYYDYYQPEAYVARTDTYIEKESQINEQIDRMRHAATRALFERKDVIIVASVSCIYGIGSPETYCSSVQDIRAGEEYDVEIFLSSLIEQQYKRNDYLFQRGCFRVKGDCIDLWPAHLEDAAWKFDFFGDNLEKITVFDPLTGEKFEELNGVRIYSNSHYVTPAPTMKKAVTTIEQELQETLETFRNQGKLLEAQRLEDRTTFDLEMMRTSGFCQGIENYSRHLTGRSPGLPPPTLCEYFPSDSLLFIDESHVTIPQLHAMYHGDRQRKSVLAEHGFRLPSCVDNRPLSFEEWDKLRPQTVCVSATPGKWEMEKTNGEFIEQIIRPTNLLDPVVEVFPVKQQIEHLVQEINATTRKGFRTLVITLTKKMAEDLTEYFHERNMKVRYIHSEIDTIERISIIRDLRVGVFDVLVGINLLREGIDIPECALVAVLDADKEGFLRSDVSLIQIIGRAARNSEAKVILYADVITKSMKRAMDETARRREKQLAYNKKHGKIPKTILKDVTKAFGSIEIETDEEASAQQGSNSSFPVKIENSKDIRKKIDALKSEMLKAASELLFEKAAGIRDEIKRLEKIDLSR